MRNVAWPPGEHAGPGVASVLVTYTEGGANNGLANMNSPSVTQIIFQRVGFAAPLVHLGSANIRYQAKREKRAVHAPVNHSIPMCMQEVEKDFARAPGT